ncbi:MAG: neutral/alkaline non-lysosomal ceramidase N-terminal domain-containing protein [Myxococcota bacterium]
MGVSVGMGRAVITPERAGASAGWSIAGPKRVEKKPEHTPHLMATALAVDRGDGEPIVLVFADLHCGGRALWRELAQRTGIPGERLIIAGTHTHAGPGFTYGSPMYNASTTPLAVPLPFYAGTLAKQIAPAVLQAVTGRVPGSVHLVDVAADDTGSNRALPAVMRIAVDERRGLCAGGEGEPADRLRDRRIRVWVVRDEQGRPFGALATAAVHGTALGPAYPYWGADWAGYARTHAEEALGQVLVGFAGGASGDVSPLALDEKGERRPGSQGRCGEQGEGLAAYVGQRIAEAVVQAVRQPAAEHDPASDEVFCAHHELWQPAIDERLAPARPGLATAGGGIDGITTIEQWLALSAGVKAPGYALQDAFPPSHAQHPKVPIERAWGLSAVPVSAFAGSLLGPKTLPLHGVRLGGSLCVTIPGEPSTFVARRIEAAVRAQSGMDCVVVGFAGDYAGYWVTPEAYDEQRYEGASTLFGRLASDVLMERILLLVAPLSTIES